MLNFQTAKEIATSKPVIVTAVIGVIALGLAPGSFGAADENILNFFSETAQSEITKAGFFFTMAAWIHAGRVKKEISSSFEGLTSAIDKVAEAFREDLRMHSEKLDKLSFRVQMLESNVNKAVEEIQPTKE